MEFGIAAETIFLCRISFLLGLFAVGGSIAAEMNFTENVNLF